MPAISNRVSPWPGDLFTLVAGLLSVLAVASAQAQPTPALRLESEQVVDFHQFIGQRIPTNGPINLEFGITWTASDEGWVGDMPFGLRTNGFWDEGRQGFAGLNASNSAMLFTFEEPVGRIGAFVNYAPLQGQGPLPTIEALDRAGRIIDAYTVDIRTPNGVNEGRFIGFEHETDDIYAFRYRARYGVLDDLTWSRIGGGIIPAPSCLAALAVFAVGSRRPRGRRARF